MLLFDLIDALERKERGDAASVSSLAGAMPTASPLLPSPPPAAGIMPMPGTPPIVPWPPGIQPPFGSAQLPWPGMPAPRSSPVPTLMGLLLRNGPPMRPSAGVLPSPAIPVSAAVPAADERPSPVSTGEPAPDALEELAPIAEVPATEDESTASDEPPQLAQAPKQQRNGAVASQQRSPTGPASNAKNKATAARSNGPDQVEIDRDDNTVEIRRGGTRSWRYNNPTNLRYRTEEIARKNGAITIDAKKFAIFPSEEAGKRAALANLRSRTYRNVTLDQAVEKWAPKHENDTAAYQRFVRAQTGMSGSTRIGSLTPQQTEKLYDAIKRYEGWKAGHTAHGRLDLP